MRPTLDQLTVIALTHASIARFRDVADGPGGPEAIDALSRAWRGSYNEALAAAERAVAADPAWAPLREAVAAATDLHGRTATPLIIGQIARPARVHETSFVDPTATVGARARVGRLAQVRAGAILHPGAVVGPYAYVDRGAVVGAGARLERSTSVGAGARIGAGALLKVAATARPHSFVGAGAIIGKRTVIDAGAFVDAHATVPDDTEVR